MKNFAFTVLTIFITLFLIILIEIGCVFLTNENERNSSFLIDMDVFRKKVQLKRGTFDPLLGPSYNQNAIESYSGEIKHNTPILSNKEACNDEMIILITGGSTSDIISGLGTWPKYLHKILSENNICNKIKIAAVSGHNSGQELLKLIKYSSFYKPDIHISYSGVNEVLGYQYTSKYEEDIFVRKLEPKTFILPYTIHFLRKKLGLNMNGVDLILEESEIKPHKFWEQNMTFMHGIAKEKNYNFFALLQPTLGIGPHSNQIDEVASNNHFDDESYEHLKETITNYRAFYKFAYDICRKHSFIFDFTEAFKETKETPFFDDCHINEQYQVLLAQKVYNLLVDQEVLKKNQKSILISN